MQINNINLVAVVLKVQKRKYKFREIFLAI